MNNKRFDKTFLGLFKKRNEIIILENLQTIWDELIGDVPQCNKYHDFI